MTHEQFITLDINEDEFSPLPINSDYLVSKDGRVYSIKSHRLLCQCKEKDGYIRVTLNNNGKRKKVGVHRLVALTYISNPENLPCVNHKDCVRSNNYVDNLEWCTSQYNTQYAANLGRIKGFRHHHTEESRRKISLSKKGKSPSCKIKLLQHLSKLHAMPKSKETLKKMSVAHKWVGKQIIDITTGQSYRSIREAAHLIGVKENQIYKRIKKGEFIYANS